MVPRPLNATRLPDTDRVRVMPCTPYDPLGQARFAGKARRRDSRRREPASERPKGLGTLGAQRAPESTGSVGTLEDLGAVLAESCFPATWSASAS